MIQVSSFAPLCTTELGHLARVPMPPLGGKARRCMYRPAKARGRAHPIDGSRRRCNIAATGSLAFFSLLALCAGSGAAGWKAPVVAALALSGSWSCLLDSATQVRTPPGTPSCPRESTLRRSFLGVWVPAVESRHLLPPQPMPGVPGAYPYFLIRPRGTRTDLGRAQPTASRRPTPRPLPAMRAGPGCGSTSSLFFLLAGLSGWERPAATGAAPPRGHCSGLKRSVDGAARRRLLPNTTGGGASQTARRARGIAPSALAASRIDVALKPKTRKSIAKRFKITATGKVVRKRAGGQHNSGKCSRGTRQRRRQRVTVSDRLARKIKRLIFTPRARRQPRSALWKQAERRASSLGAALRLADLRRQANYPNQTHLTQPRNDPAPAAAT
eukprot:GHVT01034316.1.p1 GENE.GHVT01034316.1~~GHVT01034316.1.p1  ORF type:complete len:385 (-),score=54.08 GHVT01034316.1:533-1687(-)